MNRNKLAVILLLLADVGLLAWGAMALLVPNSVPGPGGAPILPAGYESYAHGSWHDMATSAPAAAGFIMILFRLYGAYIVAFSVMAIVVTLTAFRHGERWAWWLLLVGNLMSYGSSMTYDRIVGAIGPLEVSEYLGVAAILGALALTAPFHTSRRLVRQTAITVLVLLAATSNLNAQKLHTNNQWDECAIVIDPSLTQGAWHQFVNEVALVSYLRPLASARPLGARHVELAVLNWGTRINDADAAWNDTFSHPDSTHWLFEGDALKIPGLLLRMGVTDRIDAGAYFTKSIGANYGIAAGQIQYSFINDDASKLAAAGRINVVRLYGPDDMTVGVYGVDFVMSRNFKLLAPYAGVSSYLSRGHERTSKVDLKNESILGVQGMAGVALSVSRLRLGAEYNFAKVSGYSFKLGFGM